MLCLLSGCLDSDFKQSLLSDNLLCLLHINTGKLYADILRNPVDTG